MSQKQPIERPCEESFPFIKGLIVRMYGFKADTVRKVKRGDRSSSTELGETIELAHSLLTQEIKQAMENVKKQVPYSRG